MTPLTPDQTANIAKKVYDTRLFSVAQMLERGLSLGCEGLFKVNDDSCFTGKSGGYVFRQLSGFGYIAEGEGKRRGEILIATRGTNTTCDVLSDAHVGLCPGPGGQPTHLGFHRIWKTFSHELSAFLQGRNPTHVHCVGHSLGGALATLNADYFASLQLPVSLYTFGCPRVGTLAFSQTLTNNIGAENIYRVAHNTDPVTMAPAFPFLHVPRYGKDYTIPRSGLIWIGAHYMNGYITSITGKAWASLVNTRTSVDWSDVVARAWLDAVKSGGSHLEMYSVASLNVIAQALRWLIRKALGLGLTFLTLAGCEIFTALDLMVQLLGQTAAISKDLADDTLTIMNAILQFLGRSVVTPLEITHQFLHWVFTLLRDAIVGQANRALMNEEGDTR